MITTQDFVSQGVNFNACNTLDPFVSFLMTGRTSIPIRCLIERQETGNNNKASTSDTGSSSKTSAGQTTDISRRSPSSVTSPPPSSSCTSSSLEQDTFAIIPSNIPFIDLVKATLMKLGYSTSEAVGAKGQYNYRNCCPKTFLVSQL